MLVNNCFVGESGLLKRIFDKLGVWEMGVEMNLPSLQSSGSQVSCQSWELLSPIKG